MKKAFRIFFLILIIILLVIGSALAIGLYNPRAYESVINKIVYNKTGYQYSTSDLSIQLSPATITIEGLVLSNPEWVEDPKLLELGNAVISLNLKQLFDKQLPFWNASLSEVDAQLIEDEQGQLNWNTTVLANQPKSEADEPIAFKSLLSFSELNINQAKLKQKKPNGEEEIDISSLLIQRTSDVSVRLQGAGIYKEQSVDISGNIDIDDQGLSEQVLKFNMHAQGLGIDLQTTGEVNPLNLDGAKISLKAKSNDLEKLESYLETTFPAVTPIDISLDLVSSKGNYELSKINLLLGGNVLTGDLLYNTKDSLLRINLASDKFDLGPFVSAEKSKNTEDKAEIEGAQEAEIDWAWLKSMNSEVTLVIGEILANEHTLKDLSASLKLNDNVLGIDNLSAKYQLKNTDKPEQTFASNLIKITGTAKPLADKTLGEDVQLAVNITENNTSLSLEGVANINGIAGNALKINTDIENLDSLAKYLQTDFSPYLPIKANANLESSSNEIAIEKLTVTSKQSDISGDIKVNWLEKVVSVNGSVVSKLLDLSPLFPEKNDESSDKKEDFKEKNLFSDEPIDWAWLETFNVNIDLDVNKLIAENNVFSKVETKIQLGDGKLSVKPFQAFFADGSLKSVIALEKIEDSAKLDVQLDAINLSLASLGATSGSVIEGGTTDVVMNLNGNGASLHKIMSSLNGEVVAEVQKGIIKNDAFEAIGTDIVLEMMTMLNPFMKEDETTELECAAVKFTVKDGVFTSKNQMAVETTKMKIVGGGFIDMSTEALEIGFSPSAKKGIGVNVGSLVKFVRLGGTLSNPHPEADPVGLLKSGAAIGAAVSTGGLSLLVEGLFKRATNSGSACNQALKDTVEQEENIEVSP